MFRIDAENRLWTNSSLPWLSFDRHPNLSTLIPCGEPALGTELKVVVWQTAPPPRPPQPEDTCNLYRRTGQLLSARFLHTDIYALCTQIYTHTHHSPEIFSTLIQFSTGFLTTGHCGFSHIYTTQPSHWPSWTSQSIFLGYWSWYLSLVPWLCLLLYGNMTVPC